MFVQLLVSVLLMLCLVEGFEMNALSASLFPKEQNKCEPILEGICKGMYYDNTKMPNMFNHQTQEEALSHARIFYSWIQINCSEDLLLFICSTYFPICLRDHDGHVPPCQSLCERAQNGCRASMDHLKFQWPAMLNCNQFPRQAENPVCIDKKPSEVAKHEENHFANEPNEISKKEPLHEARTALSNDEKAESVLLNQVEDFELGNKKLQCECSCRSPLVNLIKNGKSPYYKESFSGFDSCSQRCKSPYFDDPQEFKRIEFIQGLFSSVTLVLTLCNLMTFLLNRKSFPYPEMSIIFISLCYLPISIGYLLRITIGHEKTSCEEIYGMNKDVEILLPKKSLSGQGYCASVFLLTYFFSISASLWWLISTFTWFLSSALKWSYESIIKYSNCYHFFAWCISGILTALVLMTSAVEGDPITGLCSINTNPDKSFTFFFQIVPMTSFLFIGLFLFVFGFLSLFKIRREMKSERNTKNFEYLIMKMAVYGLFYLVPSIINVALITYRYRNERIWQYETACDCSIINLGDNTLELYQKKSVNSNIFTIQTIAFFMMGIVSSLWIISKNSIKSWFNFFTCKKSYEKDANCDIFKSGLGSKVPMLNQPQWIIQKTFDHSSASSSNNKTATITPLPPVPNLNGCSFANSTSPLLFHQDNLTSPLSTSMNSSNGSHGLYYQINQPSTNNTLCSNGPSISKYSKISNYQ